MIIARPPSTPPYIWILFACIHLSFSMVQLAFDLLDDLENTPFDIVRMIIPAFFVWVAGTLPMQKVRCAPNIARSQDAGTSVRSSESL